MVEVELGILLPAGARRGLDDALPEAGNGQQPALQDRLEPVERHRLVHHQDAVDDHQVRRLVHPQPGVIDGGERLPQGVRIFLRSQGRFLLT